MDLKDYIVMVLMNQDKKELAEMAAETIVQNDSKREEFRQMFKEWKEENGEEARNLGNDRRPDSEVALSGEHDPSRVRKSH